MGSMKKITYVIAFALSALSLSAQTTDGWESSADFGLTLTQGNSETTLITTALNFANDNGETQQLAAISYTFGEAEGTKTTDVLISFTPGTSLFLTLPTTVSEPRLLVMTLL